jgi:hypothetical protein
METARVGQDSIVCDNTGTYKENLNAPHEIEDIHKKCQNCQYSIKKEIWIKERRNFLAFRPKTKLKKRISFLCMKDTCAKDAEQRR